MEVAVDQRLRVVHKAVPQGGDFGVEGLVLIEMLPHEVLVAGGDDILVPGVDVYKRQVFMVVAAMMPPVSGGRPATTRSRPMIPGRMTRHSAHIPARPARHTTMVFHWDSSCLIEMTVPMWVISR